jgi:transcriptional regulator with GAF, ATPase, and Fis domain
MRTHSPVTCASWRIERSVATAPAAPPPAATPESGTVLVPLAEIERRHVEQVLTATGWNKARTARVLEVDIKTLNKKIRDFKLSQGD